MDKKTKKSHPLLTVLLILLVLILLIAAAPFLYDRFAGFEDYDDVPMFVAEKKPQALSIDPDGTACFLFDKADVYTCALYAYARHIADGKTFALPQFPILSEKNIQLSEFGYTLRDEALSASVRAKLFGFLPVQLHADGELKLSADEVQLRLTGLKYGRWISIPLEKYAEKFGIPEMTEGFVFDVSGLLKDLYPLSLSVQGSRIEFKSGILGETVRSAGESGAVLAALQPILCNEDSDAAKVLRGEAAPVYDKIGNADELSALLTELLRYGSENHAENVRQSLAAVPLPVLEIGDVSQCASAYATALSEVLRGYETELETLRDNYKALQYSLAADGLHGADGFPAETVLPEKWGARIVLQYNADYDSIVKANDGSFDPGGGWTVLPNPKLSDLKRDSYRSLPNVPGVSVFDLTLAFRTAGGSPAILFLTALDELGINVISEELYNEIITSERMPLYCASDIIAPNVCSFITPDAAQRDLRVYLP